MNYCPLCAAILEEKLVDGRQRKTCSVPGCLFVDWGNPIPVVAAIVLLEDRVVLARNAAWPHGAFSLITGYLERGETPEQAISRETNEELGLDTNACRFIGHYSLFEKNQLLLVYEVVARGEIRSNHEIAEVKLVAKNDITPALFASFALTSAIFEDWLRQGTPPALITAETRA